MDRCSSYPDRRWAVFCLPAHRQADTHPYTHTIAFGHTYPYPGSYIDFHSHRRAHAHPNPDTPGYA